MTITVSLVLLFAVVVALLLRFRALGAGAAVAAALFGFYLADTDAADTVHQLVTAITSTFADIGR